MLNDVPYLHPLVVLLNEHTMYEHILNDDLWTGVVGILECRCLRLLFAHHEFLIYGI